MVIYSFQLQDLENWLARFAHRLDVAIDDRILTIPSQLGDGIILARNVNPHFSYAIMNFKLNGDLEMRRESGSRGFLIFFTQGETQKESGIGHPPLPMADKKHIFRNDIFLTESSDPAS